MSSPSGPASAPVPPGFPPNAASGLLPNAAFGLLLAAASGWLTAQAWPGADHRALAFVAVAPFLMAARTAASGGQAALVGLVWMMAFAWGINDWFARAVSRYFEIPWAGGVAAFLAVTGLTAAPATMALAVLLRRCGPAAGAAMPLLTAAAWVAGEFFRTRVLGDPWGLLGYSQATRPLWIQVADFGGIYAVGFVVCLVNALIAESLLASASLRPEARDLRRGLLLTAVLPVLALLYGAWRLDSSVPDDRAGPRLDVAVVQGNVDFSRQWQQAMHEPNLERYLALTRQALAGGGIDLVVWPENAVTFYLDLDDQRRRRIADVLAPSATPLVAGGPRVASRRPVDIRNTAFLLSPEGRLETHYDKQRLLPFGEYAPLGMKVRRAHGDDGVREFSPGPGEAGLLDVAGVRLGVVICNEALFPSPAGERVDRGAEVLVALTNDSWVGEDKYAEQAFEKSVLRAVEQGRPLIRASTSGPSALVDPRGRVRARTALGEEAVLRGTVTGRSSRTVYSRSHDALAWLCVLGVVAGTLRRDGGGSEA